MKYCSVCVGFRGTLVAPHAGAWVEIPTVTALASLLKSLPTRERGLKLKKKKELAEQEASLPTRERGLKYAAYKKLRLAVGSLPTRERGLKFISLLSKFDRQSVAPHAGAWVEILRQIPLPCSHNRRSPRGSVG